MPNILGQLTRSHVINTQMRHTYKHTQATGLLTDTILSSPLSLRQTTNKSPVQPEMNSRNLKRAPPARSCGSSPPEKRGRTGPPSPPRSRTGSGAGLLRNTNAPTGPADQRAVRAVGDQNASRRSSAILSPLHIQSPVSRSGASTPVQNAPLAPSMLPKQTSVNVSEKTAPPSMASLQGLKLRKQAVYTASKHQSDDATSISTLANQLKAKASENDQLSERVKALESQIKELHKLKALEGQMKDIQTRLDKTNNSRPMEDITSRPTILESVSAKGELEPVSLTAVKNHVESLQKWKNTQSIEEDRKTYALKIFAQQEVDSKLGKVRDEIRNAEAQAIQRAKTELENVNRTLTAQVNGLEKFKTDTEKQDLPLQLHNLSSDVDGVVSREHKTYDKLCQHIDDTNRYIGPIKREFEYHNATLVERIKTLVSVAGQVTILQNRHNALETETKKLGGRLDMFETDKKTLEGRQTLFEAEKKILEARVQLLDERTGSLERKGGPGSSFSKVGTPVVNSSTIASPVQDGAVKIQRKKLSDDVQVLQSSLTETDSLRTQVVTFNEKIDLMEGKLNDVSKALNGVKAQTATLPDIRSRLSDLERVDSAVAGKTGLPPTPSNDLASIWSQIADLDTDLQSLNEGLTAVEKTTCEHTGMIKVLEEEVPKIFARSMDPFKKDVYQKLEGLTKDVTELQQQHQHAPPQISSGEFSNLKNDVTRLLQQPQHAPSASSNGELASLKQDVARLQAKVIEHASLQEQRDQDLVNLIATADSGVASLRVALRVLQDQYNNISSDELHGKMVQWFLQAYPSNAANMVQQFAALRQDIQNVQSLFHQQNDPTIKAMKTAIEGIQHSLGNLNSVDTPFASTAAVTKLSTQFTELDKKMNSPSTTASTEDEKRLQDIRNIEKNCTELANRVAEVKGAEITLRKEVDTIKSEFMEPHRADLACLGHFIRLVVATQKAVEMISQKVVTKNGQKLLLEWPTPLGGDAPGTAVTNKGKSKR